MGWSAFAPQGNTVAVAATTTSSTAVQVPGANGNNYLVSNTTTQAAFLAYSNQPGLVATIPVPGTSGNGVYLPPNSVQSFTCGPLSYFAVITPAATSTIYITPGDGL